MAELKSVCVYCGSGTGTDPAYADAARVLGGALAAGGVHLVYGGGSIGLMGMLAQASLERGGGVTGIIPRFLQDRERPMRGLSELVVTEDMHQRKMLMFERADAFVALPGGVGTLEELVEQMTWAQLGRHRKPVLLANVKGFWDPLVTLLDSMRHQAFIRSGMDVPYLVVDEAEDIVPVLLAAAAAEDRQALDRLADGTLDRM